MKIKIDKKRIGIKIVGNKNIFEIVLIPPKQTKWYNWFLPYKIKESKDG